MGDCVSQVDKICVPLLSLSLPVCCLLFLWATYSVSPPNLWGLWGRWGVCLSNIVTDYVPAMSDLLGFRLPLIQTGSFFDPHITFHGNFWASELLLR